MLVYCISTFFKRKEIRKIMFKVGDEVIIKPELNTDEYNWYHPYTMKIIAVRNLNRYFTDYWHNDVTDFDNQYDAISKECLQYSQRHLREKKLKTILFSE